MQFCCILLMGYARDQWHVSFKQLYYQTDNSNNLQSCGRKCNFGWRRPCDAVRAKYALTATEPTHMAPIDESYRCEGEGEDADGFKGVFLRNNVVETCKAALCINLAALLPRLVPWHVQVICKLVSRIVRFVTVA